MDDDEGISLKTVATYAFAFLFMVTGIKSCVDAHKPHGNAEIEQSTKDETSTASTSEQASTADYECRMLQRKSEDEMVSECDSMASGWLARHQHSEVATRAACYANTREQLEKCGMPTGVFDYRVTH